MEAKLRAWLESKGKAKASLSTTPRSIKKLNTGKPKPTATFGAQKVKVDSLCSHVTQTRKVLFPISSNIINPVTPKHRLVAADADTPLDKFKAMSANLKSSLAQEYINFIKTSDTVEFLQLKGIGEKMAEYILEVRHISPFK
ncbi:hypothetical protein L2E82_17817 [Cichorium intybus]|uniref:Uncharacterized protein n=1 Tax=Cichorium intybus TaxID=13427 RepID=A0ACB9F9S9_CICIN|nr:hypothetical protein L2E82_17817 [Cichorium intybus]